VAQSPSGTDKRGVNARRAQPEGRGGVREAGEGVRTTARSSSTAAGANTGVRQDGGGARGRVAPQDIVVATL
jgi:hypothetical protein